MLKPKCTNRSQAILICIDQNCLQPNPFICCKNCENDLCLAMHQNCSNKQWKKIQSQLQISKFTDNQFQTLVNTVEDVILKGIKILETQLQYFNKWKSSIGISEKASLLFENIKQNQQSKWNGKMINQLIEHKAESVKLDLKKLNSQAESIQNQLNDMRSSIKNLYELSNSQLKSPKKKQIVNKQIKIISPNKNEIKNQEVDIKINKIDSNKKDIPNLQIIQINQKQWFNLTKKLNNLKVMPRHLQLKFDKATSEKDINFNIGYYSVVWDNITKSLSHERFKSLESIVLYYPWIIGCKTIIINAQNRLCKALLSIPTFKSLKIIADKVESLDGFADLKDKVDIQQMDWIAKLI